jgi:hypothetical protein
MVYINIALLNATYESRGNNYTHKENEPPQVSMTIINKVIC